MNDISKWAVIMAAGLAVLGTPAVSAETGVTVIRGSASDADSGPPADGPLAGLVTVLRGWPAGEPRRPATPTPDSTAPGWIATGGDTLWLVERGGGRVIGCWLQGSTQAGETDVFCGQGGLR